MKLSVNPLIVAAAFGFLSPIALEVEEDQEGFGGHWVRVDPNEACPEIDPGGEVELMTIEDRVVVFDNRGESTVSLDQPAHSWSIGDRNVERSWSLDDGDLVVTTVVEGGPSHTARFKRSV